MQEPKEPPDEEMPKGSAPSDFGLSSLIARWRSAQWRAVAVRDEIRSTAHANVVLGPVGIRSEGAVGQPALSGTPPDTTETVAVPEVVIPVAMLALGDKSAEGQLVLRIGDMWREIFKACDRDVAALMKLTPRQFEEFLAGLYEAQGDWDEVILTPKSKDGGRDVIVTATMRGIGAIRILDQAKLYKPRHKVSVGEVRAMAGLLVGDTNVTKVFITTTSDFTPTAKKEFNPSRVDLRNGLQLLDWIKEIREGR